ncbi:MAG: peptidylprolyl isomerase [Deltaproteobacteria bacterium]|nr:peptidylprolyl isomerase [Deltaproteobacteria bacterium]
MSGKSRKKEVEKAQDSIDFSKYRYQLELDTTLGTVKLDFWPEVAPNHCKNMLGLAMIGFYDNLIFHRVVPGFVIQGGCPSGTGTGGPGYHVDAEFNESPHDPGVLSMARAQDPNSAGSQFFLCLEKVPFLDRQYTAFGKTADDASLAVVQSIGKVKTASGDRPVSDVVIKSAKVLSSPL